MPVGASSSPRHWNRPSSCRRRRPARARRPPPSLAPPAVGASRLSRCAATLPRRREAGRRRMIDTSDGDPSDDGGAPPRRLRVARRQVQTVPGRAVRRDAVPSVPPGRHVLRVRHPRELRAAQEPHLVPPLPCVSTVTPEWSRRNPKSKNPHLAPHARTLPCVSTVT